MILAVSLQICKYCMMKHFNLIFDFFPPAKEPTAAKSEGVENNLVTVSIQVFILCILGPVILLAVGVLIGYFWRRSKGKRKQPFYDMPR